jgi:hypothetical protein
VEAGVVLDTEGLPLYWHLPEDRTSGSLPDSRALWDVLWEHRNRISGFAHSHPGRAAPGPSREDVTTFAAIEAALGRRLDWWISSEDALVRVRWAGPGVHAYRTSIIAEEPGWVGVLRAVSCDLEEE